MRDDVPAWSTVAVIQPRIHWSTDVIDVSSYITPGADVLVRLNFTREHRVDFVGLDDTPPDPLKVRSYEVGKAVPFNGRIVTSALSSDDGKYLTLEHGEYVVLAFPYEPPIGMVRDLVLVVVGCYVPPGPG